MTETPLSHQEEDIIALSVAIVRQADTAPTQILLRHSEILDIYLESFPKQTHAIIELVGNYKFDEWDD